MIRITAKENFGHQKYLAANYIIFPGAPDESSGTIEKEASYGGLEVSYTFLFK